MLYNTSKIFLVLLLLLGTGLFFLWSCEEDSRKPKNTEKSELKVQQTLNGASTAYTFYIDSFVREGQTVFAEGDFSNTDDDVMIREVWSGVALRWGFRRKPASEGDATKVYWWQKASSDVDTQNTYPKLVDELERAKFTPTDLPAALRNENSIEVYVLAVVGDYKLANSLALPSDFKMLVLGAP